MKLELNKIIFEALSDVNKRFIDKASEVGEQPVAMNALRNTRNVPFDEHQQYVIPGDTGKKDVEEVLAKHGYSNPDWEKGTANRKILMKAGPYAGQEKDQPKAIARVLAEHAPHLIEKYNTRGDWANQSDSPYDIVISRHKYDVGSWSTNKHWRSCQTLDPSFDEKTHPDRTGMVRTHKDVQAGSMAAYLMKKDDASTRTDKGAIEVDHAIARIALKPYHEQQYTFDNDGNGSEVKDAENPPEQRHTIYRTAKIYGTQQESFRDNVNKWAEANFKPKEDTVYKENGIVYHDVEPNNIIGPMSKDYEPTKENYGFSKFVLNNNPDEKTALKIFNAHPNLITDHLNNIINGYSFSVSQPIKELAENHFYNKMLNDPAIIKNMHDPYTNENHIIRSFLYRAIEDKSEDKISKIREAAPKDTINVLADKTLYNMYSDDDLIKHIKQIPDYNENPYSPEIRNTPKGDTLYTISNVIGSRLFTLTHRINDPKSTAIANKYAKEFLNSKNSSTKNAFAVYGTDSTKEKLLHSINSNDTNDDVRHVVYGIAKTTKNNKLGEAALSKAFDIERNTIDTVKKERGENYYGEGRHTDDIASQRMLDQVAYSGSASINRAANFVLKRAHDKDEVYYVLARYPIGSTLTNHIIKNAKSPDVFARLANEGELNDSHISSIASRVKNNPEYREGFFNSLDSQGRNTIYKTMKYASPSTAHFIIHEPTDGGVRRLVNKMAPSDAYNDVHENYRAPQEQRERSKRLWTLALTHSKHPVEAANTIDKWITNANAIRDSYIKYYPNLFFKDNFWDDLQSKAQQVISSGKSLKESVAARDFLVSLNESRYSLPDDYNHEAYVNQHAGYNSKNQHVSNRAFEQTKAVPWDQHDQHIIPLQSERGEVEEYLKDKGWNVHDYDEGTAVRKVKLTAGPFAGQEKEQTKNISRIITDNPKLLEKFNTRAKFSENGNPDYHMVISRNKYDVAGMSTHKNWSSCQNLENYEDHINHPESENAGNLAIEHELKQGTIVSYLVPGEEIHDAKKKNRAVDVDRAVARIALRPYRENNDDGRVDNKAHTIYSNGRVYGDQSEKGNETFKDNVGKFLDHYFPGKPNTPYHIAYGVYNETPRQIWGKIDDNFDPSTMKPHHLSNLIADNKKVPDKFLQKSWEVASDTNRLGNDDIKYSIIHNHGERPAVHDLMYEDYKKGNMTNAESLAVLTKNPAHIDELANLDSKKMTSSVIRNPNATFEQTMKAWGTPETKPNAFHNDGHTYRAWSLLTAANRMKPEEKEHIADTLVNHPNKDIRAGVVEIGSQKHLDQLANDPNREIRSALLMRGHTDSIKKELTLTEPDYFSIFRNDPAQSTIDLIHDRLKGKLNKMSMLNGNDYNEDYGLDQVVRHTNNIDQMKHWAQHRRMNTTYRLIANKNVTPEVIDSMINNTPSPDKIGRVSHSEPDYNQVNIWDKIPRYELGGIMQGDKATGDRQAENLRSYANQFWSNARNLVPKAGAEGLKTIAKIEQNDMHTLHAVAIASNEDHISVKDRYAIQRNIVHNPIYKFNMFGENKWKWHYDTKFKNALLPKIWDESQVVGNRADQHTKYEQAMNPNKEQD